MSRFSDFDDDEFAKVKDLGDKLPGIQVGGSFSCHTCDLIPIEAYLDQANERLAWRCEEGHVSSIHFKS